MRLPAAFVRPSSLFRKEVTNRSLVLTRIPSEAGTERGGQSSKLFLAIAAPVSVSLVHLNPIFADTDAAASRVSLRKAGCYATVALENGHAAASRQSPALTGLFSM